MHRITLTTDLYTGCINYFADIGVSETYLRSLAPAQICARVAYIYMYIDIIHLYIWLTGGLIARAHYGPQDSPSWRKSTGPGL